MKRLAVVLLLSAAGCIAHEQVAVDAAVRAWSCPDYDVAMTSVGRELSDPDVRTYELSACGHRGTVRCHTLEGTWTCDAPREATVPVVVVSAPPKLEPCAKDTDCKGERICEQAQCIAPPTHLPCPSPRPDF